jgi:hypothetical protein
VLHKVVMTLKNLLGFKNLAGLPLLYAGLPNLYSVLQKYVLRLREIDNNSKSLLVIKVLAIT